MNPTLSTISGYRNDLVLDRILPTPLIGRVSLSPKKGIPTDAKAQHGLLPAGPPLFPGSGAGASPYHVPVAYGLLSPPPPPRRRPRLEIEFLTCGRKYSPDIGSSPCILSISCIELEPPPRDMTLRYSGLDRELSDWLFSRGEYRRKYRRAIDKIADAVDRWRPSRHGPRFVAIVKCMAGVHRSVAMAEKLAREVGRWEGVSVTIEYQSVGVEALILGDPLTWEQTLNVGS
ncbi:MAG: hypothetical protein LQ338_000343 [Usnochroma carphineum]|nr:MAG: hypothetical protein LQ338_000343 [Usnochroma carphineum]